MSATQPRDPIDELADAAARSARQAQHVLEGPDGPLAFALVLGLVAMAEVTIYADDIAAGMIANLLATLPLAVARRHVAWAKEVLDRLCDTEAKRDRRRQRDAQVREMLRACGGVTGEQSVGRG